VLGLLIVAVGAFGVAAASALLVTGVPARGETWTPRYLLPMPLPLSARSRRPMRRFFAAAVAAGAAIAAAPVLTVSVGRPAASAVAALGVAVLLALTVAATHRARRMQEAETAAAVWAIGCLALGAIGLATLLALAVLPFPAAAVVWAVVALAAAVAALPRRPRPPRLERPGQRAFRTAVSGYELNHKLAPDAAAVARSVAEVSALVTEAREQGLTVRTHSTGHRSSVVTPMRGEALVRVLIDEPVTVDPQARTARIPAGAKWADVLEAIAPHGLGAPHGSSGDVGVVGYLLRGGGGGFGIVTAVTIRLFPLTEVVTGSILFDVADARAVARAWYAWTQDAPAEITTSLRISEVPKLPGIPRRLAGRQCVLIDGAAHRVSPNGADPLAAVESLLAALSATAQPLLNSWRPATPHEVPFTHMDLPFGLRHAADHLLLRDLGADGVDAFVEEAVRANILCELRRLGGALSHEPRDAGAVGLYRGAFAYFAGRLGPDDDTVRETFDRMRDALSPWDTGFVVPTFASDASRPQRLVDEDVQERVRVIRARVDPCGVFAGDVAPTR